MTETLRTLFALDKNIEIFVQHLPQMVIIFALISFGGWVYETIYCSVVEGEFTKRGFLFGPTCPIYGIGAIAEWLVLGQISNPIIVFIIGAVLATVIEYSTGLFLERRFKKKWWDYSMFKFNLHGRICPQASAVFGAFSVTSVFVLVHSALERSATKRQRWKLLAQIIAITDAKLLDCVCGGTIFPGRTDLLALGGGAVFNNVGAHINKNAICFAHIQSFKISYKME